MAINILLYDSSLADHTRKKVPAEKLNIPAQVIVYGDKVAITNFKETIITVLMESKYIKETFSTIVGGAPIYFLC